jgi:prepilin-type processing-associated H-X9-DG protein
LALLNYEQSVGSLPPGQIFWYTTFGAACGPYPATPPGNFIGPSWAACILPQLEQQAVADQFNWKIGGAINPNAHRIASQTFITAFICPSAPDGKEQSGYSGDPPNAIWVAPTNIAGVSDSHDWTCDGNAPPAGAQGGWWPDQYPRIDGLFGQLGCCHLADVKDGLSNTFMLGEVTGCGVGTQQEFAWVSLPFVDTYDGIDSPWTIPGSDKCYLSNDAWVFRWIGPSSYHPGGCNFAMGDGSAHFISRNIAANILAALTTRAGPSSRNISRFGDAGTEITVSGPP